MGGALTIHQHQPGIQSVSISENQAMLSDENELTTHVLVAPTFAKKTRGFGQCFLHLRDSSA